MNKPYNKPGHHAEKKTSIAIMGATSHIAKGLINNFISSERVCLFLFARRAEPVYAFIKEIVGKENRELVVCDGYQSFSERNYDVIINCIGLGTVSEKSNIYTSFFMVTEEFDNFIISYLTKSPHTLYINFSSGAVYGRDFFEPAEENTLNKIRVNGVTRDEYFTIAKLNSEAKHRAFDNLNIIDIRIFSYFSRFVDMTGKYFITELFHSLLHKEVFHTDEVNFVRDYIHPDDLFSLIKICLNLKRINTAFDAFSLQPIEKMEIVDFFATQYGLKYKLVRTMKYHNVTGHKSVYYSLNRKAEGIGYRPQFSSMDTLRNEAKYVLQRQSKMREYGHSHEGGENAGSQTLAI